ncbi:hypothetical protein H4Q26_010641, partial [Puccinia striiformis f. sp. tritici PST-130]
MVDLKPSFSHLESPLPSFISPFVPGQNTLSNLVTPATLINLYPLGRWNPLVFQLHTKFHLTGLLR